MSKFTLSTRNGSKTAETELRPVHLYDGKVTLVPKSDKVGSGRLNNYPTGMAFSYQRVQGALATNTKMSLKMNGKSLVQDVPIGFLIKDASDKQQEISSELSSGVTANAGFTADARGHHMTHFSLDVPYNMVDMRKEEMISERIGDALCSVFDKHQQSVGSLRSRARRARNKLRRRKKRRNQGGDDRGGSSDSSKKKKKKDGGDSGDNSGKKDSGGDSGKSSEATGGAAESAAGRKKGGNRKDKKEGDQADKDKKKDGDGGDSADKKEGDQADKDKKKDDGEDAKKKEQDDADKKKKEDEDKKKEQDDADKKKKEDEDKKKDDEKDDADAGNDKEKKDDKEKKEAGGKGPEGDGPEKPEAEGTGGGEAPQGGGEGEEGGEPAVPEVAPVEPPGGGMGEGGAGAPPVVIVVEGDGYGGEPSPTAFPVPVIYREEDYEEDDDDVTADEFQDLFSSELKTDMIRAVLGVDHKSFRHAMDVATELDKKHISAGIFDVSDRLADLRGQLCSFVMGKSEK